MRPIQYIDYDKISDDILYLGDDLYLRMNVSLSAKDKNEDKRYHFHREYHYDSKYSDNGLLTVRRTFSYYITLEKTKGDRAAIMIRNQDMILLRDKLNEVSDWFKNDIFATRDNKLFIRRKQQSIVVDELANKAYIQFDPIVIVNENLGKQYPGLRVTLGDPNIYGDIDVDHFFALLYTIESFNMFLSAQALVNYLGRPNFGMNLVEMEDLLDKRWSQQQQDDIKGGVENRKIPKQNKSFFDKMNDLNKEDE